MLGPGTARGAPEEVRGGRRRRPLGRPEAHADRAHHGGEEPHERAPAQRVGPLVRRATGVGARDVGVRRQDGRRDAAHALVRSERAGVNVAGGVGEVAAVEVEGVGDVADGLVVAAAVAAPRPPLTSWNTATAPGRGRQRPSRRAIATRTCGGRRRRCSRRPAVRRPAVRRGSGTGRRDVAAGLRGAWRGHWAGWGRVWQTFSRTSTRR